MADSNAMNCSRLSQMNLLLVNDHAGLREIIRDLLSLVYSPNIQIDEAQDGNRALRLYAERGPYNVVLTDIEHPGPNGLELAKTIWHRNRKQKVGFITAHSLSRTLFDGVLSLVFGGLDLIDFVDKLCPPSQALEVEVPLSAPTDSCFSPEFLRLWAGFMSPVPLMPLNSRNNRARRLKTLDQNYADRFFRKHVQPVLDSPNE
jgi:CheY-like chemotaxis protein